MHSTEASRRCRIRQKKSPYLICVSVLIQLVRLDLRGLPVIRLFHLSLPPERKPTGSVAVDKVKKQRDA